MMYFGFAISDSMFKGDYSIYRIEIGVEAFKDALESYDISVCLNPSHKATIDAMMSRYGIDIHIPEKAPVVSLVPGDSLFVMQVRGLPRLDSTRHEYTEEEIASASFTFSLWNVYAL